MRAGRLARAVREMTGFRLRYPGDADHRGAWSPDVWVRDTFRRLR